MTDAMFWQGHSLYIVMLYYMHLSWCNIDNFGLEKYLTLLRPEYRKPICRMRLSANRLLIDMGRHNNTPRTERICTQYVKTACAMKLKMKSILLFVVINSERKEKKI